MHENVRRGESGAPHLLQVSLQAAAATTYKETLLLLLVVGSRCRMCYLLGAQRYCRDGSKKGYDYEAKKRKEAACFVM